MVQRFLEGNRRFVEGEFQERAHVYRALTEGQEPKLLWIGCADSRVSETAVTDSMPGEIFVHRNVANIVAFQDTNVAAVLEYGLKHLKIPDVVVCGHYGCGGVRALDAGIGDPFIEDWLLVSYTVKARADAMPDLQGEARHRWMVEENVRLQVRHLATTGVLRRARAEPGGGPSLHGWVYDIATGELNVVVDGRA